MISASPTTSDRKRPRRGQRERRNGHRNVEQTKTISMLISDKVRIWPEILKA